MNQSPTKKAQSTSKMDPDLLRIQQLMGDMADPNELSKNDYMLMHQRCAVCHWPAERRGRHLELHHIVGGPGRKDLPCGSNWTAICSRCHHHVHHVTEDRGGLPRGSILTAKEQEDGPVDDKKLAALKRRKALPYEREPIPKQYLDDRRRRGGDPWP